MAKVESLYDYPDFDVGYCEDCGCDDWKMLILNKSIVGYACKKCMDPIYFERDDGPEIVVHLEGHV